MMRRILPNGIITILILSTELKLKKVDEQLLQIQDLAPREDFPDRYLFDRAINSMQRTIEAEFSVSEMICDSAAMIADRFGSNIHQVEREMIDLRTLKLFELGQLSALGVMDYMEQNVFKRLKNFKKTLDVLSIER
jgi:hypothetical protein